MKNQRKTTEEIKISLTHAGFACLVLVYAEVDMMITFFTAPLRITESYTAWAYLSHCNG